jgi:CHAT domain-containing protein
MDDYNDFKSIRHKSSDNLCGDDDSNNISYVKRSEKYYLSLLVHLDNIHKVIHHKQDNNNNNNNDDGHKNLHTGAVLRGTTTVITNPILDLHSNSKTSIITPTPATKTIKTTTTTTTTTTTIPVNEMKNLIQTNNFLKLKNQSERIDREKKNLRRQHQRLDNYNEIITKVQKMTPKSMVLDMIPRDNLTMYQK